MKGQLNPKILGSTVVGFALIAGAYTVSNFGESRMTENKASVQANNKVQREIISVTDNDNNGIEDWRDEFVTAEPIILSLASSSYTLPETLTGKTGVSLLEEIIASRMAGPFGKTNDEVVARTIERLEQETVQTIYDIDQIEIIEDWDERDIVNYANTVVNTLFKHDISGSRGELSILDDILRSPGEDNSEKITELKTIATAYKNYLEDTLKIPVPALLVKEHLDLINTYSAIYTDIEAMTITDSDPAVTLLRLQRYQDDATALGFALKNMYYALDSSGATFVKEDPALFFIIFGPDYKT